jgi:uncharacterized protein
MPALSRAAALLIVLVGVTVPALGADFPKYTGYVNDFAKLLTPATTTDLESRLRTLEEETSAEVAVAIVSTLEGMTVEEYANRLFKEWGVGKDRVDNGVLVLVAPAEREMRIEVGYGLEPVLPDGLAGEIIRTNFLPHFRDDRYADGIREGVIRVAEVVRSNHVLTAEERAALEETGAGEPPQWIIIPFFGLFVAIGSFMAGVGIGSKTGFPLLFGTFFGGMPLLMSLAFTASQAVLGTLAVAAFAYGYRTGRRQPAWVAEMRSSHGRGGSSGWVMGASSSSSGSGSSSGGSSYGGGSSSFGGGSSGGGGASGRW